MSEHEAYSSLRGPKRAPNKSPTPRHGTSNRSDLRNTVCAVLELCVGVLYAKTQVFFSIVDVLRVKAVNGRRSKLKAFLVGHIPMSKDSTMSQHL